MKVTCQSCQAKYTIADEKVRGKIAKIRCKQCSTTIIVNGNDGTTSTLSVAPVMGGAVANYAHQGAVDQQWAVLIADGDQRTLTAGQITALYVAGAITYDTPAWKDGMSDWLPILQIDALKTMLDHGPRPTLSPDFVGQALASVLPEASPPSQLPPLPPPMDRAPSTRPPLAARILTPEPGAARRRPRGGSTDLFGAALQDEVMTSASANPMPHMPSAAQDRPTGARNENSVLFSLSALTGGQMSSSKPAPTTDNDPISSKADLRALMTGGESRPGPTRSKLDDIINLSGGGVYSPAMLTAPLLATPPVDLTDAGMMGMGKPKGRGFVKALVGGIVLIGGAALAYTTIGAKRDAADKAIAAANASAAAAAEALASAIQASKASELAAASAEAAASAAPTALAPGQTAPKAEAEKKVVVAKVDKGDKSKADNADKEKPTVAAATPPSPAALGVPPPAPATHEAPAPAAGGGSGDFDRAAVLSTLSAAATAVQSCKKPDGPTGQGRIAVTFANNGQATTANLEGPPFAGTPVGGCVAARFRGTHVPAFGGAPVTVHKTFNIN